MPSKMYRHYCPEEDGRQVIFSWRVCQKCGSRAEFHKWTWGVIEQWARYYWRTGLDPLQRKPAALEGRQITRECRTCNGHGLLGAHLERGYRVCSDCKGAGGFPVLGAATNPGARARAGARTANRKRTVLMREEPVRTVDESPVADLVEEDRILVSESGEEGEVRVSRIQPGLYRVQDHLGFQMWAEEDTVADAGFGWLLRADESQDGRLHVWRIERDPAVETVGGWCFCREFTESTQFGRLGETIMSAGGNWQLCGGGVFSAYMPKAPAGVSLLGLTDTIEQAHREWFAAVDPPAE
jgi:hypothetical protein